MTKSPTIYLKSAKILCPREERDRLPLNLPALKNTDTIEFDTSVTFFVGENGSGKSTLLEAIAILLKLGNQGGTGNFDVRDRYGNSGLHEFMRLTKSAEKLKDKYYLRAESLFNVADYLDDLWRDAGAGTSKAQVFARYGGKSLHEQSHGESFMAILVNALGGKGIYLFDEPEAALSPQRQLSALARIHELVERQSQFIIATHSPILMSYPNSRIYSFGPEGLALVKYEETEHFQITRDFLNAYPSYLRHLLSE